MPCCAIPNRRALPWRSAAGLRPRRQPVRPWTEFEVWRQAASALSLAIRAALPETGMVREAAGGVPG